VYRALQAAGLRRDGSSYRPSYRRLRDTSWLRERYLVQGARMKDIAADVAAARRPRRDTLRLLNDADGRRSTAAAELSPATFAQLAGNNGKRR
jgi:hypothetical protein